MFGPRVGPSFYTAFGNRNGMKDPLSWLATEVRLLPYVCDPPYSGMVPAALGYLRAYIADAAYIPIRGTTDSATGYKAKMYSILWRMDRSSHTLQEMRILKLWAQADWGLIWDNLCVTPGSRFDIATWYKVIPGIRLKRIHTTSTDACTECGSSDTLLHRLTECGEGSAHRVKRDVSSRGWFVQRHCASRVRGYCAPTFIYGRHAIERYYGYWLGMWLFAYTALTPRHR